MSACTHARLHLHDDGTVSHLVLRVGDQVGVAAVAEVVGAARRVEDQVPVRPAGRPVQQVLEDVHADVLGALRRGGGRHVRVGFACVELGRSKVGLCIAPRRVAWRRARLPPLGGLLPEHDAGAVARLGREQELVRRDGVRVVQVVHVETAVPAHQTEP